ncbi:MAG TPA: PAS domain-containing protein [Candidatus Acidoferrum sp.]|nr:PAS domain-containing protein [Candidatus Acidoferrum sp.]
MLDALLSMLSLDLVYARLKEHTEAGFTEDVRFGSSWGPKLTPHEFGKNFQPWLRDNSQKLPMVVKKFLGECDVVLVPLPLGLHNDIGIIVAGSQRQDFPQQTERLVLNVAANQAAIGLHEANILRELDQKVAKRTLELTSANEKLHDASSALEKAFDEIKKSEAKLRRVIDAIPTIAWCNLPDGPNEFLNKSWHEYTGLSPEESHGWGWGTAFHPDDLPPLLTKWQEMLVTENPGEIEARIRRHDGVYRWFLIRAAPFLEDGKLVRWYGTSTDIDDRKRTEVALRDSEQSSRLILDGIAGLVAIMSATGAVIGVNRQVLEYFGKTVEELKFWSTTDAVHPDDLPSVICAWTRSVETSALYDVDHRLRGADGVYRWFHARGLPLHDEEGHVVRWYVLLTDIDDRRRAEEALRASERELDLIVNTIPAMAWSARPDGSAEFFNLHYLGYVGLAAEQLRGSGWTVAVHPDDLSRLVAVWQSMIASGKGGQVEGRLRRFDGEYRWFLFRTNPMLDASGNILKWYGTNADIDDRKRAEEELRNMQMELERVMRAMTMGQLTASIAHEVNQPLSGIVTNAGTCLRMLDATPPNLEGARETVRRTIRDGNRASEVISRLRTLYSKKEPALEPMDLNEATREVIALSLSELQRNKVALRLELAEHLPLILGDRIQIQQVILNLVRNGSDAMNVVDDRPKELVIKTECDESSEVRLSVKDSGVGFAPRSEQKLFEAFYTTKSDGMGIGLSVSRSIMENHRGRLWAVRNEGPGATFLLSIPGGTNT